MAIRPSRFHPRITGPAKAAQVIPVHSAHTASMIAQASRVPRLQNLHVTPRGAVGRGKR
jgi:hypothetical protein